MKTDRNQLTSVGQHCIWSLSDELPEKEVFQLARIFRDGIAEPILAEETPSFLSTTALTVGFAEDRGPDVSFVRARQDCKSFGNNLQFAA